MGASRIRYSFGGRGYSTPQQFVGAIKNAVEDKAWQLSLAYSYELAAAMAEDSPVRTGHFRSWWSVANPGMHPPYSRSVVGSASIDMSGAQFRSMPLQITNQAKYAMNLEMGGSDQAPRGTMRLVLANHDQYFAIAARKVKGL